MPRLVLCSLIAVLALAGCGKTPTAASSSRDMIAPARVTAPTAPAGLAPGAADPRVSSLLALVQKLRDSSTTADSMLTHHFVKSDGSTAWLHSHYKYQKPKHNAVELLTGSDSKVNGTELVWTGESKVKVKTKFIGFWLNVDLDLGDDRLKDPAGYRIDQTSIDKVFDTLLCPQNQISYMGAATQSGKPVTMLSVVSPLSLKPTTREVFGIDATGCPMLREMYKGNTLFYKMEVESTKVNPKLTAADFQLH